MNNSSTRSIRNCSLIYYFLTIFIDLKNVYIYIYRNDLASVSADNRVKIWDVVTGNCDITMEHHLDKASKYKLKPIIL
jgi:WD40 repeat protein